MSASFVHLRMHTEYSLVDGLVRVKPLVKALTGLNMPAVAVTDQNNLCSLVKFYKAAILKHVVPDIHRCLGLKPMESAVLVHGHGQKDVVGLWAPEGAAPGGVNYADDEE